MNKLLRSILILSVFAIVVIASVMPVIADEYNQDDWERAQCVHIEINTGPSGQYINLVLYQDAFDELVDSGEFPAITIEVTEPNTVLEYNVVVAPQTLIIVSTPKGIVEAYVWENGEFYLYEGGVVSWRIGDMNTECLGGATDGRINNFAQQMLAAIYPDGNGGYDVWAVDPATSNGTFDYNVSRAEVDAGLAAAGSGWQVIGSGSSSFYAADGQCVLTSPNAGGETQTFVFACSAK